MGVITVNQVKVGKVGDSVSWFFSYTGSVDSWEIASGQVPSGLTLNSVTGEVSGILNQKGGTSCVLLVRDGISASIATVYFSVTEGVPDLIDGQSYFCQEGVPFNVVFLLKDKQNSPATNWAASGLPVWMSLDSVTGEFSGVPPSFNYSGTVTIAVSGTTATATLASHAFRVGQSVTISGASVAGFNGTFTVLTATTSTFTYTVASGLAAPTGTITALAATTLSISSITVSSTTATATTSAAHGLSVGQTVVVAGASLAGYNGSFVVVSIPSSTTFTYTIASALAAPSVTPTLSITISTTATTSTATSSAAHNLRPGQSVTISGANIAAYNATHVVAAVLSATQFTFTLTVTQANPTGTITAVPTTSVVTATLSRNELILINLTVSGAGGSNTKTIVFSKAAAAPVIYCPQTMYVFPLAQQSYIRPFCPNVDSWEYSGNLPTGFIFDASTGEISGNGTLVGVWNLTIRAINASGYNDLNIIIGIFGIEETKILKPATINIDSWEVLFPDNVVADANSLNIAGSFRYGDTVTIDLTFVENITNANAGGPSTTKRVYPEVISGRMSVKGLDTEGPFMVSFHDNLRKYIVDGNWCYQLPLTFKNNLLLEFLNDAETDLGTKQNCLCEFEFFFRRAGEENEINVITTKPFLLKLTRDIFDK